MISTFNFLDAIFAGQTDGFVELRHCLPNRSSVFMPFALDATRLTQYEQRLREVPAAKPYFGIATRGTQRGRNEDCARVAALYIDADFKYATAEEWRAAFDAHPYPVSILVATGGGYQGYWLLDSPYEYGDEDARQTMRRTLDRWRLTFPHRSDELIDTARVFRLPNTLNRKYDPPCLAEVVVFEPTRRYAFAQLQEHADATTVMVLDESAPERGYVAPAFVLPSVLEEGALEKGRHYVLGTFLRSIKSRYELSWDEAWALLRVVNRDRVKPEPIPEKDLKPYLKRWWDRPDTDSSVQPAVRASSRAQLDAELAIDAGVEVYDAADVEEVL